MPPISKRLTERYFPEQAVQADCAPGITPRTTPAPAFQGLSGRTRSAPRINLRNLLPRVVRACGQVLVRLDLSTWLLLDIALLLGAFYYAYEVLPPFADPEVQHVALWQAFAIFSFTLTIASAVLGLHERETLPSRARIIMRVLLTAAVATIFSYAIIYVVMYATIGRRTTALAMSLFVIFATLARMWGNWAVHHAHRELLVVGPRELWESFQHAQASGLLSEYRLVGRAGPESQAAPGHADESYRGPVAHVIPKLSQGGLTDIVVGTEAARDGQVMDWVVPCLQSGCRVTNEAIFYEKATGQILVDQITPAWFLFADLKVHSEELAKLKRVTDLLTAALGLLFSAPLWPLIALAIKLGDGGPVFYAQDRVGQNGRIFRLYKFRTMRCDAENGKSVWAAPDDPRATRVGRFLRRSRLDELPQLYNILMGKMSVVGPRPERPDIVSELCQVLPYYAERHLVKPGLTGWAQINFRYGASVEDARRKLQFDLYYLKHMSFELDLTILFRTVGTFLRGAC